MHGFEEKSAVYGVRSATNLNRLASRVNKESHTRCHLSDKRLLHTLDRGQVNLTVWLEGLAYAGQPLVPVHSASSGSLGIKREDWLTIFQQLGAGARRLVELSDPRLPREVLERCTQVLSFVTELTQDTERDHFFAKLNRFEHRSRLG